MKQPALEEKQIWRGDSGLNPRRTLNVRDQWCRTQVAIRWIGLQASEICTGHVQVSREHGYDKFIQIKKVCATTERLKKRGPYRNCQKLRRRIRKEQCYGDHGANVCQEVGGSQLVKFCWEVKQIWILNSSQLMWSLEVTRDHSKNHLVKLCGQNLDESSMSHE